MLNIKKILIFSLPAIALFMTACQKGNENKTPPLAKGLCPTTSANGLVSAATTSANVLTSAAGTAIQGTGMVVSNTPLTQQQVANIAIPQALCSAAAIQEFLNSVQQKEAQAQQACTGIGAQLFATALTQPGFQVQQGMIPNNCSGAIKNWMLTMMTGFNGQYPSVPGYQGYLQSALIRIGGSGFQGTLSQSQYPMAYNLAQQVSQLPQFAGLSGGISSAPTYGSNTGGAVYSPTPSTNMPVSYGSGSYYGSNTGSTNPVLYGNTTPGYYGLRSNQRSNEVIDLSTYK